MSEWPCQGGEEGGGAGGAGPKLSLPLPPIHRTLQVENQTSSSSQQKPLRPAVFSKLEHLVREMQDGQHGVPVRSQKLFLTSIPAAFMGYDLIEWLMDRLCIEDSPVEAVHLANLLCQFGYYFPVNEQKNLLVKDDSSLYRFQSPYYWPSQHHTPDNIEYAIYLYKRAQRRRNIHGLEPGLPDYEMDALNNLKKILAGKWENVTQQGEDQLKAAKDRKKGDKIINDSQEKAYWRVYRPPPGYNTLVESSPVPTREQRVKARRNNKDLLKEELEFLKQYLNISRVRTSQVAESLLDYTDTFVDYDPILVGVGPSNPWMTDDLSFWDMNKPIPETPTKKRVERWAISLEDTVTDPLGTQELLGFMKKEYCHENMRFWLSVQELKRGAGTETKIKKKVKEIWEEFLSPGAGAEINIDGKTMEETKLAMKNPTRHTFDRAADHVYTLLLKKDCYPRFLRSEHYKQLLANSLNPGSSRKRFFNFAVRKKPSQIQSNVADQGATSKTGREARDPGIHMGTEQSSSQQRLKTSQECDEACPWETEQLPPSASMPETKPPDVTRSRKVSNAGATSILATTTAGFSTVSCDAPILPILPIDYVKPKFNEPPQHVNNEKNENKIVVDDDVTADASNKTVSDVKKMSVVGDSDNNSPRHRTAKSSASSTTSRLADTSGAAVADEHTEMEVTEDGCEDDKGPLISSNQNSPRKHLKQKSSHRGHKSRSPRSQESRQRSTEDNLVMQFDNSVTRMNLSESCATSSRKASASDSRMYTTSLESSTSETEVCPPGTDQHIEGEDDGWINDEVQCPWEDEKLTPTWL